MKKNPDPTEYEPLSLYELAFRLAGKEPQEQITDSVTSYVLDELLKHLKHGKLKGWYKDREIPSYPPFEANKQNAREIYINWTDFKRYCKEARLPRRQYPENLNELETTEREHFKKLMEARFEQSDFKVSDAELNKLIDVLYLNTYPSPEKRLITSWPEEQSSTEEEVFKPNSDYSVIFLRGGKLFLTKRQADIIRILHREYKKGTPWIRDQSILEEIRDPDSEFKDAFRSNRDAEGKLIAKGERGTLRLNI